MRSAVEQYLPPRECLYLADGVIDLVRACVVPVQQRQSDGVGSAVVERNLQVFTLEPDGGATSVLGELLCFVEM